MVLTGTIGAEAISDEFFGYVSHNVNQDQELCGALVDAVESDGPFDGLMGFSEGGTVAAMMLIEDLRHQSLGGIKCAVFFSAALPWDPDALRAGTAKHVDPAMDGCLLTIPTAHLWSRTISSEDIRIHESLANLCEPSLREIYLHDLGHDVPGFKSEDGLHGALRAIERTVEKTRA